MKHKIYALSLGVVALSCNKEAVVLQQPIANEVVIVPDTISQAPGDTILDAAVDFSDDYPEKSPWQVYTILEGNNYNEQTNFAGLDNDSLVVVFRFDSTAIYQTADASNQKDWCKLVGFSDCGSFHQLNSVRLVWRWSPEQGAVELGSYIYRGGNVSYSKIHEVAIGEKTRASIYVTDSTYNIAIAGMLFSENRTCNNDLNRYLLMPYFGGNEPAPQDINVHMRVVYPEIEL